jgi:hypothetical protein
MKTKLLSLVALLTTLASPVPVTPAHAASQLPVRQASRMPLAPVAPPPVHGDAVADRGLPDVATAPDAVAGLPLAFIPNRGQMDAQVDYYTQSGSHSIWFTADGVTLTLPEMALRLAFVDANPATRLEGHQKQPGVVSYFIGNDPAEWRTRLPTYGQVTYRDLWPGVNLSYQGGDGALTSTFTVAPGADPAQIRLAYPEADELRVSETGELVIRIGETEIRESPPVAWQEIGDRHPRVAIRYQVAENGYTFALPDGYDPAYPLVIDPELRYSTFLGGSEGDSASDIAMDSEGNIYVVGYTQSSGFPTTPGAYDTTHGGGTCGAYACPDAFVVKLNASGTALVYATFIGTDTTEHGSAIAVDGTGSAYVVGYAYSSAFPTTPGAYDTSHNGGADLFALKLNASGTALEYATFLGGTDQDWHAGALAVDVGGSAYIAGYTRSSDFPTTPGAYDTSHGGGLCCSGACTCGDVFVVKLNADGTDLEYGTFLGADHDDDGYDIAVDQAGSAYVTGIGHTGIPTTTGAYDTSYNGGGDVFVVKLNSDGTGVDYGTFVGSPSTDCGTSIAVNEAGSAYVAGYTYSSVFTTTPVAYDADFNGGNTDAIVMRLGSDGTQLDYATYLGGDGDDYVTSIALDEKGCAYVTGSTDSTDFPTSPGAVDTGHNGGQDAFVAVLGTDGTSLGYATYLGGDANDYSSEIVVTGIGNTYVAGSAASSGFPTVPGSYDTSHNGGNDAFVSHLVLFSYLLAQGDQALANGRQYRADFHAELGGPASVTISDTLAHYEESGLMHLSIAEEYYEAALRWAEPGTFTETRALEGLLDTHWELATGAMLSGNEFMVQALDVAFENPSDPLAEEIGQLQEAVDWYTMATEGYVELLASEHYTALMALQPTRVHPINGGTTPYLDLQRLALAAAKKSRAYLELAERQFRKFTPTSQAAAEATLRRGAAQATADLALLDKLWAGAVDDASYQALLHHRSDMQRLFRYLQENKNPFGYGPEYVPFHFQPANLPKNNFQQTMDLAQAEKTAAEVVVNEAEGRQQQADDNYVILQQRLADVTEEYDSQLIQLCGADPLDPTQPDLEMCHENASGEMYAQILRIEEANLRIQLVEQQMDNQLELIRIEQERAARVAGIHRATAEMWTATGEKLADLAMEEVKLRERKTWTEKITGVVTGIVEGATMAAPICPPYGAIAGGVIGGLAATAQLFEEDTQANQMGDLAAKRERLEAQQSAYVAYAEAEIVDANSEALIKQYMLRFTEYDIELSIAVNNLQQELARLNGLKTEVEYLAAEKENALAFTENLYQDPAGRVLRDYYMELADDRFDVALRYAYRAARALEYEINQDAAFESGPLTDLEDVYQVRDITTLGTALAQMSTTYNDFLARPDVPTPQQREDVIYLSEALGFEDAYDADLGRIVTAQEKLNAFIQDPANRDDDGNLSFTFQTSIYLGNPFYSTGVFNDKIVSIQMRLRGTDLGNDRAIVYLRQDGTSFIRTVDAFRSSGPDDVRAYNVHPLKASITAATNDHTLDPGIAVNRELATRSVAFTNWTLTLDQVNEPENQDVDINTIQEIEMTITHEAFTLQSRYRWASGQERADSSHLALLARPSYSSVGVPTGPVQPVPAQPARAVAFEPLSGIYVGTAVISDPVGLSPLDLAIVLTDTTGSLSGYVDAERLLAYPVVSGDEGAAVRGAWSGVKFILYSTVFTDTATAARRQVFLHNGVISDDGETLTGDYSEVLWGLTPELLVVKGTFQLIRPAHLPPEGQPVELQVSATPAWVEPLESASVTARLVDFYSNPISQTLVSFSASAGTVTPLTATTNISGEAFVTYTAPDTLGQAVITATSGDLFETVRVQVGHCSRVYLPLIVRSY